jgi:alkanesulfonate monooxygenase SsuD/methylene tetrahydromethanopterin reductase-like flavin-dependent oxidoreductase (luciferase family)
MEFAIHIEPEGSGFEELLRLAQVSEEAGFALFSRSDHFLSHERMVAPHGPTDAWVTMGAIARETSMIGLSVIMANPSFRHPAVLAVALGQIDVMSGDRLEFGMGAGWFEREIAEVGVSMPGNPDERYDRREEYINVLRGIWRATEEEPFSYSGSYYTLSGNRGLGFAQPRRFPRIILALTDAQRTVLDAIGLADECNIPFVDPTQTMVRFRDVDAACEQYGRKPESLARSVTVVPITGTTEADIERRRAVLGASGSHVDPTSVIGSPRQVQDYLARYADAGVERVYLQVRDSTDLDLVRLLGDQVAAVSP